MRALLAVVLLGLLVVSPAAHAAKPLVVADADVRVQGRVLPRSFLGFSQEFDIAASEAGLQTGQPNPALVGLYRNLTRPGTGAPVLRVGGGSQDAAWWNPTGAPRPPEIRHDVTPEYLAAIKRFLDATGSRLILGLNLGSNDPRVSSALADAAQRVFDARQLKAFELGNAPDLYPKRVAYRTSSGRKVYTRPRSYTRRRYLREFGRHLRVLRRLRPVPDVAAPGSYSAKWLRGSLRRFRRRLTLATIHRYALTACDKRPGQRGYPTARDLLRNSSVFDHAVGLFAASQSARRAGVWLRLTETNSRACRGAARASDRFAAALWGIDWTLTLAAAGLEGVNLHSSDALSQPYAVRYVDGEYIAAAKPLYYAMLMFAEMAPHRPRFLPTTYFGLKTRRRSNIKVWGVVDKVERVVRVAVIHKGGRNGRAVLRIPYAGSRGKLARMRAPGPLAATGVTWAGQGIASLTTTGALEGDRMTETVRRRSRSRFVFKLPRYSAAVLTVPVRRVHADRFVR